MFNVLGEIDVKFVNQFKKYYEEKPHMKRIHEEWFESTYKYEFDTFIAANKMAAEPMKYKEIANAQSKAKRVRFSYVETWKSLLVLKIYQKTEYNDWYLEKVYFKDLETDFEASYANGGFKQVAYMMMSALEVRYMYNVAYDGFYSYHHNSTDESSIELLKSFDKFKYIPLEKFEKMNYFRLMNATDDEINTWEILIKLGATRTATDLMLGNLNIDKNTLKKYKLELQQNKSVLNILNKKAKEKRLKAQEMSIKSAAEKEFIFNKKMENIKIEDDFKGYHFTTPNCHDDLIKEGKELKHCVGNQTYLLKVIKQESLVLFIREKKDSAFFTVEYDKNGLVQCRSKNNVSDKIITEIAKEYFNKNKVILNYVSVA